MNNAFLALASPLRFGSNGDIFCLMGNFDWFQQNSYSQNMLAS